MRPVNRNALAPAVPARENEPFPATVRVHAFALRLRLVGLTQRFPLRRPLSRLATLNRTDAAWSSANVTRAPVAVRKARALGPVRAARNFRGDTFSSDSR